LILISSLGIKRFDEIIQMLLLYFGLYKHRIPGMQNGEVWLHRIPGMCQRWARLSSDVFAVCHVLILKLYVLGLP
jgi:hypothetical protein